MKQNETHAMEGPIIFGGVRMEHQGKVLVNVDTDAYARDDNGGAIIIATGINGVSGQDGDGWICGGKMTRPLDPRKRP
jgi:hypothetical protein